MAEAAPFFPPLTEEQSAKLTVIWDQLYKLYLEKANGDRSVFVIDREIDELIKQRNAVRPWGWDTGRNWRDDLPPELKRPREV
ncbi:MAG TPA: hypothetical protein VFC56_13790 [Stellaceae bacterium]|nr:hypothetical protein [Stellaceae bacterium]